MGQADSQFKAFIRFVIDALREIYEEKDEAKRAARLAAVPSKQGYIKELIKADIAKK